MRKVVEVITELATPICAEFQVSLWNVEYVREAGHWYLRVYLDKPDGIGMADCEAVSRALDPLLDQADHLFPHPYTFEVSSAGAERPLRRDQDFLQFIGHRVEVRLYQHLHGAKEHIGTLTAYDAGDVTIDKDGEPLTFTKAQVAAARLRI